MYQKSNYLNKPLQRLAFFIQEFCKKLTFLITIYKAHICTFRCHNPICFIVWYLSIASICSEFPATKH